MCEPGGGSLKVGQLCMLKWGSAMEGSSEVSDRRQIAEMVFISGVKEMWMEFTG